MNKWISTESGGPQLIINKSDLSCWAGDNNDDYQKACSIDGYIGELKNGKCVVQVLWDEPFPVTWKPLSGEYTGALIRWVACEDEEDAQVFINSLITLPVEEEREFFTVKEGGVVVWDASCAGNVNIDFLEMNLMAGNYDISTAEFKKGDSWFVVHFFKKRDV
jgi:hypothetical protein